MPLEPILRKLTPPGLSGDILVDVCVHVDVDLVVVVVAAGGCVVVLVLVAAVAVVHGCSLEIFRLIGQFLMAT